jgi:hypothetical protein
MRQSVWRFAIALGFVSSCALIATAAQIQQQRPTAPAKRAQRTALSRLISGPTGTFQTALAGTVQPTAEILLIPVANNPTGPYGHRGYYSDADITGHRLTVSSGGGRTFWNAQIRNWGPSRIRSYEVRVDALGLLGSNADCGSGPGSCVVAADLLAANQTCTTTLDCIDAAGEAAPTCVRGLCAYAWIARGRDDWLFANNLGSQSDCGVIDPAGANCFAALDNSNEARIDDGQTYYAATYSIDVPTGARGVYQLPWVAPNISTFLGNDATPPVNIPLAAAIPGELEIARGACCFDFGTGACTPDMFKKDCLRHPTTNTVVWSQGQSCDPFPCTSCTQDPECDDDDACTTEWCDTYCRSEPIPQWDPATMCCDPATGAVENLPELGPCFETYCSPDGTAVVLQSPTGEICDPSDPCMVEATCAANGECVGTVDVGSNCPKPRYISFTPVDTSGNASIEVTLVSLHHPSPQPLPTLDFAEFEGQQRWVSEPFDCPNSDGRRTSLKCATLTCSPVIFDFWSALRGETLHITGDAIIPSSVYNVEQFPEPGAWNAAPILSRMGIKTADWGDVAAPFQDPFATTRTQPNVTDLAFIIDRAADLFQALDKPRVQLRGKNPNPRASVGIADIILASDAINGVAYPYGGPSPCPP